MTPSRFQLPAGSSSRTGGMSLSVSGAPPAMSIRLSLPSDANASDLLSGDHVGAFAPSARQQPGGRRVQRSQPQRWNRAGPSGGYHDLPPIRRCRKSAINVREPCFWRWVEQELDGLERRRLAEARDRQRAGYDEESSSHEPWQQRLTPSRWRRCGRRRYGVEQFPDVADVTQPLPGILFQTFPEQPAQLRRCAAQVRLHLHYRRDRLGEILALKQPPAGDHLVKHNPERPDVRALVHRLSPRLFGRDVGGGAKVPGRLRSGSPDW